MDRATSPWIRLSGCFAGLTALGYGFFTLLPNSHGRMVDWPLVLVWQLTLVVGFLWGVSQLYEYQRWDWLGRPWDYLVFLGLVLVFFSLLATEFRPQALTQVFHVLAFTITFYSLRGWLRSSSNELLLTPQRRRWLLWFQGILNLGFITIGLCLWLGRVYLPEHALLSKFRSLGVELGFDFNAIQLRNPYPLGHANYVAGYLLLALPVLLILFLTTKGKGRWFWLLGLGAGLVDIYLTSSRGGFLGLGVIGLSILFIFGRWGFLEQRSIWALGFGSLALGSVFVLSNNRFQQSLLSLFQGRALTEFSFRSITNTVGWQMGGDHWLTGAGLGSVPLLYQKYRPVWAGQEAEWLYELLSTPMQFFAELGIGGLIWLVLMVVTLLHALWLWLQYAQPQQEEIIMVGALASGLGGYGVMALTDFQVDNLPISGSLLIYGALLASFGPVPTSTVPIFQARPLALGGLALLLCLSWSQVSTLRAWHLSDRGFAALKHQDFPAFEEALTQARELAPWEPYYPELLGTMLGEVALKTRDQKMRGAILDKAIAAFEQAIIISPYREFTLNNLGVLQMASNNPAPAAQSFSQALKLTPAKAGLFYQLGLSLQAQGQTRLAILAFSLECLRHPLFITSPLWRGPLLKPLYDTVQLQILKDIETLLKDPDVDQSLRAQLYQIQGGLYWWQGNWLQAEKILKKYGSPTAQALVTLALYPQTPAKDFTQLSLPTRQVIKAWQNPQQRSLLLQQAWAGAGRALLGKKTEQRLLSSMAQAQTFTQWLQESAPIATYRRYRLGHNVNSRHLDGPNPQDFFVTADNIPMNLWFADVFPTLKINPPLDEVLQPWREELIRTLER